MTTGGLKSRRERTKHELRCFCRGNPLLAMYGVDPKGELYVHVKVHKQSNVYGEFYFTGGIVRIRCRNCLRWNRVIFVTRSPQDPAARLEETEPPAVVSENPPGQSLRPRAPGM